MSDERDEATDQPLPAAGVGKLIHDAVCEDLQARKAHGTRKYGRALQADNGRNALLDAYEEALDLAVYLRQALAERGSLVQARETRDAAQAESTRNVEMRRIAGRALDEIERIAYSNGLPAHGQLNEICAVIDECREELLRWT